MLTTTEVSLRVYRYLATRGLGEHSNSMKAQQRSSVSEGEIGTEWVHAAVSRVALECQAHSPYLYSMN